MVKYLCACCWARLSGIELGDRKVPSIMCKRCYETYSLDEPWLASLIVDERNRRSREMYWDDLEAATTSLSALTDDALHGARKVA